MVGSQVGLFQHVSSVRQRRFAQYSRRNRHANNTAASQTDPSGIRGEARRISSRTTILLRIRSTDTRENDSERSLSEAESPLFINQRARLRNLDRTRKK